MFHMMLEVASGRKKTFAEQWKLHNAISLFNPAPVTPIKPLLAWNWLKGLELCFKFLRLNKIPNIILFSSCH